jgi:hypothetical protein
MASIPTPLSQSVTGTADAAGSLTLKFPTPRVARIWQGTVSVTSVSGIVWNVTIGGAFAGRLYAPGPAGPFQIQSGLQLAVSATGLSPGLPYTAVLLGTDDSVNNATPFTGPAALTPPITYHSLIVPTPGAGAPFQLVGFFPSDTALTVTLSAGTGSIPARTTYMWLYPINGGPPLLGAGTYPPGNGVWIASFTGLNPNLQPFDLWYSDSNTVAPPGGTSNAIAYQNSAIMPTQATTITATAS